MDISKAIEILTFYLHDDEGPFNPDGKTSLKLGIEALKRHQDRERVHFSGEYSPLPGETKE